MNIEAFVNIVLLHNNAIANTDLITVTWFDVVEPMRSFYLGALRNLCFIDPVVDVVVGSVCGLGPDLVGIHSISLAARYRTSACSNTLNLGLEKIQASRSFDFAPILALCPQPEKDFLAPSMARSTADACNIVRRWDHDGKRYEASQNKKQKVATGLLRESPYGPSRFWDRFTVVFLRIFCNVPCTAQRFHTEGFEQMYRVGCPD